MKMKEQLINEVWGFLEDLHYGTYKCESTIDFVKTRIRAFVYVLGTDAPEDLLQEVAVQCGE